MHFKIFYLHASFLRRSTEYDVPAATLKPGFDISQPRKPGLEKELRCWNP